MVSGMACFLTFDDADAESRFLRWVVRGNERNESMGLSSLGLKARVLKVGSMKYLFLWEHLWVLNLRLFLRFMLWLQFRRVRKNVRINRVVKYDLIDLVLSRGLKD